VCVENYQDDVHVEDHVVLTFLTLNSLSYAAILFIVASGFTMIFGLLQIVNLAHGAFYLLGGYIGMLIAHETGSFVLALAGGAAAIALLGLGVQSGMFRFVRGGELQQVLSSVGLALVLNDLILIIWGGDTFSVPLPAMLQGGVQLGFMTFPVFRLFLIGVSVAVFAGLWLMLTKTRFGSVIRAGVDDAEIVDSLGIDVRRLFALTFMLGSALAGLGGVLGGAFLTLYPTADAEILVFSLAVVVIGGRGSLVGAAIGSLLIGFLATFGQVWFPELSYFVVFGPMALLLAFRPLGMFGKRVSA
jgi:branched-chain amino acid transport system permease protein